MFPKNRHFAQKFTSRQVLPLITFFLLIFAILFSRAMTAPLNHDEHQFVAGAQLFIQRGLLPYRDYPFLHMPYMLIANALPLLLTDYDFLAARLLTAIYGLASASLIFRNVSRLAGERSRPIQAILAGGAVILYVTNQAYLDANGRALNHAVPNFLSLLALEVFLIGFAQKRVSAIFFAGILTGLATGTRLTYALLVPAFTSAILICSLASSRTPGKAFALKVLKPLLAYFAGFFLALLPVFLLAAAAPRSFLFGNLVYIHLNTGYRQALNYRDAMTLGSKLAYFAGNLLSDPVSGMVYFLAALSAIIIALHWIKSKDLKDCPGLLISALGFCMFISAFAPTPTWPQYFFAPLPFLILNAAWLAGRIYQKSTRLGWGLVGLCAVLLFANGSAKQALSDLKYLAAPSNWVPIQIHRFAQDIKKVQPQGRILTLAPVFPLEAGLDTYEMFTVGPLVWRSAHILSAEKRRDYGIIAYNELDQYLQNQPPDALLLGVEDRYDGFWIHNAGALEGPLLEYAEAHGYHPLELSPGFGENTETLWVK